MKAVVIDTNVPVVANGRTEQAGPDCVLACLEALESTVRTGKLVLDDALRIVNEYMNNLSMSGQPGAGDSFMKWIWQNQANPDCCERVHITPRAGGTEDYKEFPDDPDLAGFDPPDRKFAAVARASRHGPVVLNAADTDWWDYKEPLERHGVSVEFLCPELMGSRRASR